METRISVLSPLHIGTGVEWQPKFEYINFKDDSLIAVLDEEKVLSILGEENLHHWVACIQRNDSLLPLLQTRKPDIQPSDVAKLIIRSSGTLGKAVSSLIRSEAIGKPYLPGSSLKGAIRTALFAHLLLSNHKLAKRVENLGNSQRHGAVRWNAGVLESIFFGQNPNQDIFRVLHLGDAHFSGRTETCVVNSVNKYRDGFRIKDSLTQVVEVIPKGGESFFRFSFNEMLVDRSKRNKREIFNQNVHLLTDVNRLFSVINDHTLRLVEDEIDYWANTAGDPECIGRYVDEMIEIKNEIKRCSNSDCVLRVGWGSGFRFITGDWHGEMTEEDYNRLVKTLRPKHPIDLMFPKTMRIADGGIPLGFIKLTIQ